MRCKLLVACLACTVLLGGCANPAYSGMGGGKGQTMMMPSEISTSNKLNEPVSKRTDASTSSDAGGQSNASPQGQSEGQRPPEDPSKSEEGSPSTDRAQL